MTIKICPKWLAPYSVSDPDIKIKEVKADA